jgi:ABC-type iron transport system FetAB permease component
MIPIFVALLISFDYYLVVIIYNISHLILLLWIIALSTQAVYYLQKDSELRSALKVFTAFFISYILISIVVLIEAADLISRIIR